MQGANSGLTEDIVILSGSIQVGSGGVIDVKGKTLGQIADEITAQGEVTASIQDGKFTIKSEAGEVSIDATGDFSRVTGIGSYTVQAGSTSNTSAQNVYISQGAAAGLTGSETVVSGTIKVGSGAEIDTAGKTLNEIIGEINSQGVVTASIQDGKFTIESEASGISIQATGDMARVSGLASYQVQAGTTTNVSSGSGADETGFVRQVDRLTEEEAIAQGYTIIKTARDLNNIRNNTSGKYILMSDIDMSGFTDWTPIGEETNAFTGTLDGNGYVLKNFNMDFAFAHPEVNGLFGYISGATIKNLGMENISITSSDPYYSVEADAVGGLVGHADASTISNCYVTGEINASSTVTGGLVGEAYGGSNITDCSADIEITTSADINSGYAGGLVGTNDSTSSITNSSTSGMIIVKHGGYSISAGGLVGYNEGDINKSLSSVGISVDDGRYAGGLVGEDRNGTISNCGATGAIDYNANMNGGGLVGGTYGTTIKNSYATGDVYASYAAGGLVGEMNKGTYISDSFATGMTVGAYAGGLVGEVKEKNGSASTISRCYASGYINGGPSSYGLVGDPDSSLTIEYSFWDKQKTGTSEAINSGSGATLSSVVGLNTADFANAANFTNFGWDESIWDFSGSTPTLKNMFSKDDASSSSTLTGSVNTNGMTDTAFDGQSTGQLSFSNGVNVSIDADDTRSEVIQKINDAGLTAEIGSDGKIKITAQGVSDLKVTSDSSGFADFYGLSSSGKTYSGSVSSGSSVSQPATSTITGSVNTNNFADNYFYGQTDGQISFSNGVNVSVSATDTRSDVLDKINDAGLTATIGSDGKIQIKAEGVSDLKVNSDSSGFSNFYGLDDSQDTHTGSISTSTETVPDPDGGDGTGGDGGDGGDGSGTGGDGSGTGGDGSGTGGDGSGTGGDGSGTGGDGSGTGGDGSGTGGDGSGTGGGTGGNDDDEPQKPPFDVAGLKTEGISNIRLQVGIDSSEASALYCDTTFLFDDFSLDMSTAEDCNDSIDAIDALIDAVKSKQTDVGVYMTRLEVIYDTNVMKQEHKYAAYSSIMDADIAAETQKYVEYQIRQQTAMSLLAQTQAARTQMIMTLLSSVMG